MNKKVAISIILFALMFGITSLIPTQIITMERPFLILVFLMIVVIPTIWFFRTELNELVSQTTFSEMLLFAGLSLSVHFIVVYFIKMFAIQPNWPFDSRGASFLLLNNFYIWIKPLDIFVQQLLITLLVLRLKRLGLTLKTITIMFVFGFGIIHILQVLKTDVFIGLLFTLFSITFSFIFPRMILRIRNGYIYNYMIHLATYNVAALIAWFVY